MSSGMPVVDLTSWRTGGPAARGQVARDVSTACATLGFFQVIGHGVAPDAVAGMTAAADRVFGLAAADKRRLSCPPEVRRGFSPVGTAAAAGELAPGGPSDRFEAFELGPEVVDETDPAVMAVRDSLLAPNVWPSAPSWLRQVLVEYFDAVAALARTITRVFAAALDLPEEFFLERCQHPTERLRLIRYADDPAAVPPVASHPGMSPHTDDGILTVLHADQVPGFELVGPDGRWWPVMPVDGAFVVNIGDLLAEWTNDRWRSTVHRVVAPTPQAGGSSARRSAAFFFEGDHDCLVECLPTCTSATEPPRYAPFLVGDRRRRGAGAPAAVVGPTIGDTVSARIGVVASG